MTDGLLVVDKPSGMTSHDVVARCRRVFSQRRVGHAGTLDPDATGVLLVGLGRATRLLQFLSGLSKRYEGEIVLGVATSTLDAAGEETGRWDMSEVTLIEARHAASDLTGTIQQIPPMVSAIKIGGRRLHQLAREGIEVDRPPRSVTISQFVLDVPSDPEPGALGGGPVFGFDVECSSGTYVRTLAADLGARLGGGAHLRGLRRTAVGPWVLADAVALDEAGPQHVIAPAAALRDMAQVAVGGEVAAAVGHGAVLPTSVLGIDGPDPGDPDPGGPWAVVDSGGALLAVYRAHGPGRAKPVVVLSGDN